MVIEPVGVAPIRFAAMAYLERFLGSSVLLGGALLLGGCPDDPVIPIDTETSTTAGDTSTSGGECMPGQTQPCTCPDGSMGMETCSLDGEGYGYWWDITATRDERAVVRQDYGQLSLVDATDMANIEITTSSLPGYYGCWNPVIGDDEVYCPMGSAGLETVEW